jgi:hypothetical protein
LLKVGEFGDDDERKKEEEEEKRGLKERPLREAVSESGRRQ